MAKRPRITYNKLESQAKFHLDNESRYLMFNGGLGSGKTYALAMKALQLSALNKDIPGGFLAPSFPEYKKDVLPTIEGILEDNNLLHYTKIHRTDHWIRFPWSKAPMYFFTAEKQIKGPNLGYGLVNEHSSIKWERIKQFNQRVRVKDAPYRQVCYGGTPEDEYGWLHEFVEKQTEKGRLTIINGKTTDNPYNDEEYIEELRDSLDPLAFRLFAMGEMISLATDLFYYSFSKSLNVKPVQYRPSDMIYINMDFNVGNMHATCCQQRWEGTKKISSFFDQIVLTHSGADTHAMLDRIDQRFPGMKNQIIITCDASGRNRKTTGVSDIKLIESKGYQVRYRGRGNPRLRMRQLLVNGLFHHSNIEIDPKCAELVKDCMRVKQKEDYTKDDSDKARTHSSDTLDYYCDFEYDLPGRTNGVTIVKR